tara:strand:- start:2000 stop:2251 length:252 start_codon:yes stop_codon:yes gene_type:complete
MKKWIDKYIEWIGFIILIFGVSFDFFYKYFFSIKLNFLSWLSFAIAGGIWTITDELKKEKPKIWLIYSIINITLIIVSVFIFV